MPNYFVSEAEIHPCYFITPDDYLYDKDTDFIIEMSEEEFNEIDQACCEFEHAMSVIQGKIDAAKAQV